MTQGMNYDIVFFDIDGTLVNDEKQVPDSAIKAILQLQEKGIESVIATGRAPYFFQSIAQQVGIHSYVSLNGGYVVYKGELVERYPIPKPDLEMLIHVAEAHHHSLVFEGSEGYCSNIQENPYMAESIGSLKVKFPDYNPRYWREADIYQVFLHCTKEDEHFYESKFSNLRFVRWHRYAMDVMPAGGSKARGILDLLRILNINPARAVAFGDSYNDREMLSLVGMGIAMGNAVDELKALADHVTSSVDDNGIANGLKAVGLL